MVNKKRAKIKGDPPKLETTLPNGDNKTIHHSKYIRLLEGNLQNDMTWRGHIEMGKKALLPSVRSKLGGLKLLAKQIPEKGCLILANGLILSKINYLIPVWGGTHVSNLRKVQCLLNSTARFVLNVGKKDQNKKFNGKLQLAIC